jgi:ParB family chromosome partitioning protein
MTRRALGRGLSALLSDTRAIPSDELLEVDLDLIDPSEVQPRTNFDEGRLDDLAQSIRTNGIVQPLLVRRREGRYQLIAGERRWRAARKAGLKKVPVIVREVPDEKLLELALIENIQRQELNPIEEAHAYKRLIETLGLTQEMIAQRIGRDRSFVANYLRLLRLPQEIQRLVEEEKLSMGHARALLAVDDPKIQRKLAEDCVARNLSVREMEQAVKRVIAGVSPSAAVEDRPKQVKALDPNVQAAENRLRRYLSTKVHIVPDAQGEGGRIEIEYYDMRDLDRIYRLLLGAGDRAAAT